MWRLPACSWTGEPSSLVEGYSVSILPGIRDRYSIYGLEFQARAFAFGLEELKPAPEFLLMQKAKVEAEEAVEPFLLAKKLRSGDVILTLGTEKFSTRITDLTGAGYSHVTLVVSEFEWFEADDEGVGFSTLLGMAGWLKGQGLHERVIRLRGCAKAAVFSHPALKERTPKEIEASIREIVEPWEGEDYSDYRRLFNPLAISGRPAWWVKLGLRYYQWRDRRRSSGMFCSEVVARVFEALEHKFPGASLFSVSRRADLVHPGHFEASRLEAVEGSVGYTRQLPEGMQITWQDFGLDRRFPTRSARDRKNFNELLAQLDSDHAKQNAILREEALREGARREHEIRELLGTAQRLGTPKTGAKLVLLLKEIESHANATREYFDAAEPQPATFFELSLRSNEFTLRLNALQCDFLEEATSPDQSDFEQIKALVAASRVDLSEKHGKLKREWERIRKKFDL